MIRRPTFFAGACGAIAAPALARGASIMSIPSTERIARSVSFTIRSWAPPEPGRDNPDIVPLHLSNWPCHIVERRTRPVCRR
jgi:hypothetical protein